MSRAACIDVGSNTTRLLVAEVDSGRLREILAERAFTSIGARCQPGFALGEQTIADVAEVVARQVRVADEVGVDALRVVATAAVRRATDREELVAAIDAECGALLEILSGEEEARLAFAGAIGMLADPPRGDLAVVDVGGGSTELVVGTAAGGVTWSVSLPVGSNVVTASDLRGDPPTPAELTHLRAKLAQMFANVQAPRPSAAYAVGGSATSLQRLIGAALEREALARGLKILVNRPSAEVALRLGLHAERARLLPAGILLLDAASRALHAPLQLAGGGLREGVVFELLARV